MNSHRCCETIGGKTRTSDVIASRCLASDWLADGITCQCVATDSRKREPPLKPENPRSFPLSFLSALLVPSLSLPFPFSFAPPQPFAPPPTPHHPSSLPLSSYLPQIPRSLCAFVSLFAIPTTAEIARSVILFAYPPFTFPSIFSFPSFFLSSALYADFSIRPFRLHFFFFPPTRIFPRCLSRDRLEIPFTDLPILPSAQRTHSILAFRPPYPNLSIFNGSVLSFLSRICLPPLAPRPRSPLPTIYRSFVIRYAATFVICPCFVKLTFIHWRLPRVINVPLISLPVSPIFPLVSE